MHHINSKLRERGASERFVLEDSLYQRAKIHPLITTGLLVGGGMAVAAFVASKTRKTGPNGGYKINKGRQLMANMNLEIKEHMEVIGSDGEHVGTVDKLENNYIKLTRTDSPDGKHHRINMDMVETIESGKLVLMQKAEEVRSNWGDLGESERGEVGSTQIGNETGDSSQGAMGGREG